MPSPGDTIHHYEILELLGKGGMGEVFLARDTVLDRQVALKFLPKKLREDPTARQRFLREAKAAAALDNPFICKIYEMGEIEGKDFIAMEYVAGQTLQARIQEGPLSLNEAFQVATEIAEALEVAHGKQIVHRDLKPANIMITEQGHAKVMDFGLAKRLSSMEPVDSQAETVMDDPTSGHLTKVGATVGTLPYMSPEQARGEELDARSDIFAFGVLLQEMLSAEHPFKRESGAELLTAILRDEPPPLPVEVTDAIPNMALIVARAMAKEVNQRYSDIQELTRDLRELREEVGGKMKPTVKWSLIAAALVLVMMLLGGTWWFARLSPPAPVEEPQTMSVLIADFQNQTGDPVFDGALEQTLAIGMEGASFITTYNRGQARRIAEQLQEGVTDLDQPAARLVAQREGINVIIDGSISQEGEGYGVSLKAIDAITGEALVSRETTAASKDDVLAAIGELAVQTRNALGDTTPESVQLAAEETFTAASLEAAQNYAIAQDLQAVGNWQEAVGYYSQAVELDPTLGRAYAGLAAMHHNLGQPEEAGKYYQMAMERIDRMSDREKYRTRGGYYISVRNFQKAIEEFSALVGQYPADDSGLSNLALAHFYARNMSQALEQGRRGVEIYPKNTLSRANLALYAMYSGDFETAISEAAQVVELNPAYEFAYISLGLSELAQGEPGRAAETYRRLEEVSERGSSLAAIGLADLALYQGRLTDAAGILERAIASDLANNNAPEAGRKLASLAHTKLLQNQPTEAVAKADQALAESQEERVLFEAARIYLRADQEAKALEMAAELGSHLEAEPRAYARLIEGEVQLDDGQAREALNHFQEAQELLDTWLGRFDLGRAYLEAGAFTEAYSELEQCVKRRGEATAVFLDDLPTFHYFPPVYYYLGRAQEG